LFVLYLSDVCGILGWVYVILAPVADRTVPCVYAFLQRKTQETYEILLNAVDDLCTRAGVPANPTHVTTDFESSCIAAVRQVFGDDVTTHGCFYHLTQSTWRKIQVKYRPQQPY